MKARYSASVEGKSITYCDMPTQIFHQTECKVSGPFHIERSKLEVLDEIAATELKRMEQARATEGGGKSEIGAQRVQLHITDGRTAEIPNFEAALRDPALRDDAIGSFSLELECGIRKACIELKEDAIVVRVEPRGDPLMEQTFIVLKSWVEEVEPPIWLRFWRTCRPGHWVIIGIAIIVLLSAIHTDKESRVAEAKALVHSGISTAQYGKALELLVAQVYQLDDDSSTTPNWVYVGLCVAIAYGVLLTWIPKSALAVGSGATRVRWAHLYCRSVAVTAPLWAISTIFWPRLEPLVRAWLTR